MSVVKTKPKQLLWPITTGAENPLNQSELKVNTCYRRRARENAREQVTIGFGFASETESGARFFSQSQCAAMQTKEIAKLLSTLNWKPL